MKDQQIPLRRPAIEWPSDASLIGYEFSDLLIAALNQDSLIAYLGWYVDSPIKGRVWHRWATGTQTRLGVSLIVAIYALWIHGFVDVALARGSGYPAEAILKSCGKTGRDLPSLEGDILRLLNDQPNVPIHALMKKLPLRDNLPTKRRGLRGWLGSGASAPNPKNNSGWFRENSTVYGEGPAWVQRALDVSKGLVTLHASMDLTDLDDEGERERREEATARIEARIFDSVRTLR